jgi:hypothetical protein
VRDLARTHDEFTVEDIAPLVQATYDLRALGGIMLQAKRHGWIEAAGYVNSGRARHGKPIRCWRSRLFDGRDFEDIETSEGSNS